ncbi:hypothetical protein ACFQWC_14270 [Rossellomorea sp. GCM10028870]|uniref:hypothetical protein n=1 Tax=Rossellomorea sp. GCM10028870 TaxID=3273426 RepID=UPI0036099D15
MKPPKNNDSNKPKFKEPGEGAILFAAQFTEGIMMTDAMPVIQRLMKGELHDSDDKRVKNCDWCGYLFRDKSRPNIAKTCCKPCKFAKDNFAKKKKKAEQELVNPRKKPRKGVETYYASELEYPFFINEKYMLRYHERYEKPFSPNKISHIKAARDRNNGNRRKPKFTLTDGSDRVNLRGIRHGHNYGPVTVSRMKPEEVEQYLIEKYGERHLKHERDRVERFKCSKKVHI